MTESRNDFRLHVAGAVESLDGDVAGNSLVFEHVRACGNDPRAIAFLYLVMADARDFVFRIKNKHILAVVQQKVALEHGRERQRRIGVGR